MAGPASNYCPLGIKGGGCGTVGKIPALEFLVQLSRSIMVLTSFVYLFNLRNNIYRMTMIGNGAAS